MQWQLAAAIGGAVSFVLAFLVCCAVQRTRQVQSETAFLRILVATAPIGLLRLDDAGWRPNTLAASLLRLPEGAEVALSVEAVLERFTRDRRDALQNALTELTVNQRGFEITVATTEPDHVLAVVGCMVEGSPVLWIRDDSDAARTAAQLTKRESEVSRYQKLLDTIQVPIWWRDGDNLEIIGSNRAYQTFIGGNSDITKSLAQRAHRLGQPQSESRSLAVGGNRRTIDISEAPVQGLRNTVVGIGIDMTALSDVQTQLAEHIEAQDMVLERLTTSIAIFGPDKRLRFFNDAYVQTTRLPRHVLEQQPTFGEIFEMLRENRQLPETSDFQAYKRVREDYFTGTVEPIDYLIHKPDGQTLHAVASRHPNGGLIFQYHDVTDRLALESSYNTLIAVQRSTLDSLFEAVCVFGRDGRLKLFNFLYPAFFGLDPEWLKTGPHVSELVEKARGLLRHENEWEEIRYRLIHNISEPKQRSGRTRLTTGKVIEYAYKPLPDGQVLIHYLDVTDSTKVEEALQDRNRALEKADLLKRRFVANVSYELRTPLNAIMGFAELLKMDTFGNLTQQQLDYVDNIMTASDVMADLVSDILDLAAVQAGFMEFDKEQIDLADEFQKVEKSVRQFFQFAIDIQGNQEPSTVFITVDRRRTQQALRNILIDALRHCPVDTESGNRSITVTIDHDGDGRARLRMVVPPLGFDKIPWPKRACGVLDEGLQNGGATGADVGISLARSLIQAQRGEFLTDREGNYLDCVFPT